MAIAVAVPGVDELAGVLDALAEWQDDDEAPPLHPGDVGGYGRFGPRATASALPTWSVGRRVAAVARLDGPALARLAVAPDLVRDEARLVRVARDLTNPSAASCPPVSSSWARRPLVGAAPRGRAVG